MNVTAIRIEGDQFNWATLQSTDRDIELLYTRLKNRGLRPTPEEMEGSSWETKCLWALWQYLYMTEDGVMYYQYGMDHPKLIVVPERVVMDVLHQLHVSLGHVGQNKLESAARRRYWWPHQRRDIRNLCNSCEICAQVKNPQRKNRAPLRPILTGYPNEVVNVDMIGPLPESLKGNRYIIVMVDTLLNGVKLLLYHKQLPLLR